MTSAEMYACGFYLAILLGAYCFFKGSNPYRNEETDLEQIEALEKWKKEKSS